MTEFLFKAKTKLPVMASLLVVLSLLASFFISRTGIAGGAIVIVLLIGVTVLLVTFNDYRHGFLIIVLYSFFMFYIGRVLPREFIVIPLGTIVDLLLVLVFFAMLLHQYNRNQKFDKDLYRNPPGTAIFLYILFFLMLLMHPGSRSISGRILAVREIAAFGLTIIIVVQAFQSSSMISQFSKFWIFLALLAGLYGIFQEVFGLRDFEREWLYSDPEGAKLAVIWGHVRKWSFLSDINAFGLLMAYGGIVCAILITGPFSFLKKAILAFSCLIMLVAMVFSGTRTAYAMVLIGFVFFVVMALHQWKTVVFAGLAALIFVAILFGPFYGGNFSRLRSTFRGSDDVSMNVRDQTRERMQPYVRSHPIGGGLNTSGKIGLENEPGHALAGDWDPDSGYLKTAVERGWLGLLIQLGLFSAILIYGLKGHNKSRDPYVRTFLAAYLSGFFALTVANFTQDSMDQKPIYFIVLASWAIIIRLSKPSEPKETSLAKR